VSKETNKWLAEQRDGRFSFVFTPKHGSWLNLVEGFFSKMARSVLRRIRVADAVGGPSTPTFSGHSHRTGQLAANIARLPELVLNPPSPRGSPVAGHRRRTSTPQ
jgi:hypothetical protein